MSIVPAILRVALLVAFICATGPVIDAGECQHCGCEAACKKVCHPVCKTKKVKVTCWDCKCEPFCLPGPGKACQSCGCCDDRAASGHVHARKKLMRKEVEKEILVTEWVVEDLCAECKAKCTVKPARENVKSAAESWGAAKEKQ
jgi:hypothetical protein